MSALALTLLRLGFLALLWVFVLVVASVLRRDLAAPQDAIVAPRAPSTPKTGARRRARRPARGASALAVVHGANSGTILPLTGSPVTIGRSPECTLQITDDYASNNHAQLSLVDGYWMVQDLGSTNGTWIDRSRITGRTVLEVGVPLRIGRTVLELRK